MLSLKDVPEEKHTHGGVLAESGSAMVNMRSAVAGTDNWEKASLASSFALTSGMPEVMLRSTTFEPGYRPPYVTVCCSFIEAPSTLGGKVIELRESVERLKAPFCAE